MRTLLFFCLAFSLEGQIVQPGAGGGGSNSTLTLPSSLGTCTNLSGSFTCTYATGQTPNLIQGTDASGNVGLISLTSAHMPSTLFPSGVLTGSKSLATVDQIPPVQPQTVGYQPNQTLSGCGVEYTSGLSFTVGACTYTISGTTYHSVSTNVTLAVADPTNPRIDVIGVDNTGAVFTVTGTPASGPQQPTVDPTVQLQLTFVYVPANSTTPQNVTTDNIYDEGTEWTATGTTNINTASTNNPYHLTKDVEATSAVLNNNVKLVKPASGTVDLATRNNLVFYIRSKAQWPTGTSGSTAARYLSLFWQNGTTVKGNTVVLRDGQFGFSSATTTGYQQISIPTSLFGINGIPVTTLVVQVSGPAGSSSIGWYLDEVTLQGGQTGPVLPSTLVNWRGTWSSTTAYNYNDLVVSSGGTGYVAVLANTGQTLTNTSYWQQLTPTYVPIVSSYPGTPGASALVYFFTATDAFTLPANLAGSVVSCGTSPAASMTYTLANNGSNIGTVVLSTSCTATFTTTGGTAQTIAAGNRFTITAPGTADTTAANIAISLRGLKQ